MLALAVFTATAFVCPPVEEGLPLRKVGEKCGGTCGTFGDCQEGLECHVENTSPFSFAILQGAAKAGMCRPLGGVLEKAPVEEQRRLQRLGGGMGSLAGGHHDTDVDSPEVKAAAKWAVTELQRRSNSLDVMTVSRIVSAQQQVVAGIKYTLDMIFSDGAEHRIQVVDQPWMSPRYTMLADEIVATP